MSPTSQVEYEGHFKKILIALPMIVKDPTLSEAEFDILRNETKSLAAKLVHSGDGTPPNQLKEVEAIEILISIFKRLVGSSGNRGLKQAIEKFLSERTEINQERKKILENLIGNSRVMLEFFLDFLESDRKTYIANVLSENGTHRDSIFFKEPMHVKTLVFEYLAANVFDFDQLITFFHALSNSKKTVSKDILGDPGFLKWATSEPIATLINDLEFVSYEKEADDPYVISTMAVLFSTVKEWLPQVTKLASSSSQLDQLDREFIESHIKLAEHLANAGSSAEESIAVTDHIIEHFAKFPEFHPHIETGYLVFMEKFPLTEVMVKRLREVALSGIYEPNINNILWRSSYVYTRIRPAVLEIEALFNDHPNVARMSSLGLLDRFLEKKELIPPQLALPLAGAMGAAFMGRAEVEWIARSISLKEVPRLFSRLPSLQESFGRFVSEMIVKRIISDQFPKTDNHPQFWSPQELSAIALMRKAGLSDPNQVALAYFYDAQASNLDSAQRKDFISWATQSPHPLVPRAIESFFVHNQIEQIVEDLGVSLKSSQLLSKILNRIELSPSLYSRLIEIMVERSDEIEFEDAKEYASLLNLMIDRIGYWTTISSLLNESHRFANFTRIALIHLSDQTNSLQLRNKFTKDLLSRGRLQNHPFCNLIQEKTPKRDNTPAVVTIPKTPPSGISDDARQLRFLLDSNKGDDVPKFILTHKSSINRISESYLLKLMNLKALRIFDPKLLLPDDLVFRQQIMRSLNDPQIEFLLETGKRSIQNFVYEVWNTRITEAKAHQSPILKSIIERTSKILAEQPDEGTTQRRKVLEILKDAITKLDFDLDSVLFSHTQPALENLLMSPIFTEEDAYFFARWISQTRKGTDAKFWLEFIRKSLDVFQNRIPTRNELRRLHIWYHAVNHTKVFGLDKTLRDIWLPIESLRTSPIQKLVVSQPDHFENMLDLSPKELSKRMKEMAQNGLKSSSDSDTGKKLREQASIVAAIRYELHSGRIPVEVDGNPHFGFDLLSFDLESGTLRSIEVKSTVSAQKSVWVSKHQYATCTEVLKSGRDLFYFNLIDLDRLTLDDPTAGVLRYRNPQYLENAKIDEEEASIKVIRSVFDPYLDTLP